MFKFFILSILILGDILYIFEKFPKTKLWAKTAVTFVWNKIKEGAVWVWNKIFKKKSKE
jgi:hypothetical protein